MAEVVLFVATSLDGYIADAAGGVEWITKDVDPGYDAFYAGIDRIVMGRRTYEEVAALGAWPYPGVRTFVLTNDDDVPVRDGVTLIGGDLGEVLATVVEDAEGDVWLVGGAESVAGFRRAGCIDRYILSIHPVLLGEGVRLFERGLPRQELRLVRSASYPGGVVQVELARPGQDLDDVELELIDEG